MPNKLYILITYIVLTLITLSTLSNAAQATTPTTLQINPQTSDLIILKNYFPNIFVDRLDFQDQDIAVKIFAPNFTRLDADLPDDEIVVVIDESKNAATIQEDDIVARLIGQALPYPNPMRFNTEGGVIAYKLSQPMDIEIRIYNIAAHEIYRKTYQAGAVGGLGGSNTYNEVPFSRDVVGEYLPVGVYFYLLIHDGHAISKGKLAIIE